MSVAGDSPPPTVVLSADSAVSCAHSRPSKRDGGWGWRKRFADDARTRPAVEVPPIAWPKDWPLVGLQQHLREGRIGAEGQLGPRHERRGTVVEALLLAVHTVCLCVCVCECVKTIQKV